MKGGSTVRKSRVCRMIEKGRCGFCERPLVAEREKGQGLCDRCFDLRRLVKKW